MLIPLPPKSHRRRVRLKATAANPPPTALTLVEASFDTVDGVYLRLTFDRAIDASGLNGSAIQLGVNEFGYLYDATGPFEMYAPETINILMVQIGGYEGDDILNATSASGIVAVDDGGAWAGVTDITLPYP
jgi:hypothetical protein